MLVLGLQSVKCFTINRVVVEAVKCLKIVKGDILYQIVKTNNQYWYQLQTSSIALPIITVILFYDTGTPWRNKLQT